MSKIEVNTVEPQCGTAVTLGASGDTITVPTGAGLTVVDEVKTNKISPATGTAFTLGDSGDTFTVPAGATFSNLGTATGFAAISWQSVVTASTLTAEAGKGYWIDTTSNTCTITLPASASNGDQIIFVDYAKTWGTNKVIIDSNGLNFQGIPDTDVLEYTTSGQTAIIIYSGATKGWIPQVQIATPVDYTGLFAFGNTGSNVNTRNLVSSLGVVASDATGAGTARNSPGASSYGGDKGIIGFGYTSGNVSMTNLVSNEGVVALDVTGVGAVRRTPGAAPYGSSGQCIFAFGLSNTVSVNTINLVSNEGVMATDTSGTGTARNGVGSTPYGGDKGIMAFGHEGSYHNVSNLISNAGVVATDTTGVGTARYRPAGTPYGVDKGIMAFGSDGSGFTNVSNLISNAGVVATDTTGVGTARELPTGLTYGGDKAIIAFGYSGSYVNTQNLVNSSGVVATDTSGVGTARNGVAGMGLKGPIR